MKMITEILWKILKLIDVLVPPINFNSKTGATCKPLGAHISIMT